MTKRLADTIRRASQAPDEQGGTRPQPFNPAWWLPGPHLQTLWPYLTRRPAPVPLRFERLSLPDGDFLDLAWTPDADADRPLVIVLHGLEGSVRSHYTTPLLHRLHTCGVTAVLMHFRNCSGEPNRLPRSYNAGDTGDLDFVVETLRLRFPRRQIFATGYSLGGNVLLKWLAERGEQAPLEAAVAVSVPFDLQAAAARLERGLSRLYQQGLLRQLRRSLYRKFAQREAPIDLSRLQHLNTFRAFDDYVTAPLHGYAGVDDYYNRASSRQYLPRIEVPTLIIQARDDPFLTPDAIPSANELGPRTTLEVTERGGHVGFVAGNVPGRPHYWLDGRITAFVSANLRTACAAGVDHASETPSLTTPSYPR